MTDEVMSEFDNFNSFQTNFTKRALLTIYIHMYVLQTLKTWSHFFHKESKYLITKFLGTIHNFDSGTLKCIFVLNFCLFFISLL